MSEHLPKVCIIDALDSIDAIFEYCKDLEFEDYMNDRKTRDAIYRNIEVIGEAADRTPQYFQLNHPEIPWQKMLSTRNSIAHGYDKINDKIIWNIINNLLPDLKSKLEKLLDSL
jgi:uncharacterized protein with HEPN domain